MLNESFLVADSPKSYYLLLGLFKLLELCSLYCILLNHYLNIGRFVINLNKFD